MNASVARSLHQSLGLALVMAFSTAGLAASPITNFLYDANGNLTEIQAPLTRTTKHDYDALNRPKQTTDAMQGVTKYGYDGRSQVASISDPRLHTTSYTVDGLGNQSLEGSPDRGGTAQTFDAAGNLKTRTDARSKTTTYTYDALNRLTKATFQDGTSIRYTYDQGTNGVGRLTSIAFPPFGNGTAYTYDPHGHVTSKIDTHASGQSLAVTYNWDADKGRLTSMTYHSGKELKFGYDDAGRINKLEVGSTVIADNISYVPFGPPKSWTWGSGQVNIRTFDTDGRMKTFLAAPNDPRTIEYDDAGRIKSIKHPLPALAARNQFLSYDNLDRVTGWLKSTNSRGYAYDATGNREMLTVSGTPYDYTNDPASNRINTAPGPVPARTFSYDNAGNITSDTQVTYLYNDRGRLAQATKGSTVSKYTHDGLGQRVKKLVGSIAQYYVYDEAGHLLGTYNANGNAVQEYVYLGDMPIAVLTSASSPYYVYTDQIMRPWTLVDVLGQEAWKWDTSPFGEMAPAQNPSTLGTFVFNLRFPGQYYDSETGLFYNINRSYDPQTGRYLESDPIGLEGGINTYAYVEGNPINGVDPWGLDTYKVNRDLARFGDSSASQWNPITHTFTAVTNPDGSIANTYSWGNDANLKGWNKDQPLDMKTAREAIEKGSAEKVGNKSLDPFVKKAFDILNRKENEHSNWIVTNNCKAETNKLLDKAKQLQNLEKKP